MLDPYSTLGVDRSASDDEVKKAYRKMSRKYHPDANINNPDKDKAEEKFKEIQQAYDQIMRERQLGSGFKGFAGNSDTYHDEESMRRRAAANYIQSGHYREAMNVLASLGQRNGEWYYLSAIANQGLGNNVNALSDIREACRLDPDNQNYRMMLNRMEGGGSWYTEMQSPFGGMPTDGSGMCMNLCLANLVCNLCFPGSFCCI